MEKKKKTSAAGAISRQGKRITVRLSNEEWTIVQAWTRGIREHTQTPSDVIRMAIRCLDENGV